MLPTSQPFQSDSGVIECLHALIREELNGVPRKKKRTVKEVLELVEVFRNLLRCLEFPHPRFRTWSELHEKITLYQVALDVTERVVNQLHDVLRISKDLYKQILTKFLAFYHALELWEDATATTTVENMISPVDLKESSLKVIVMTLHRLSNDLSNGDEGDVSGWTVLRATFSECLDLSNDLLSRSLSLDFPITVALFCEPRILNQDQRLGAHKNALSIMEIESNSQLLVLFVAIIHITVKTISPTYGYLCFMVDVIEKLAKNLRAVFDSALSPQWNVSPNLRRKVIWQLLDCISPLTALQPGLANHFTELTSRVVTLRLIEGPKAGWESFDDQLLVLLKRCPPPSAPAANASSVIAILKSEKWGEEGDPLKAIAVAYLSVCFRALDGDTVQRIKKSLPSNAPETVQGERPVDVNDWTQQLSQITIDDDVPANETRLLDWHHSVRGTVQQLITPQNLSWMDDEATSSRGSYSQRALDELRLRFEKPLHATSEGDRLLIVQQFNDFLCLVASCDKQTVGCSISNPEIGVVPSCLPFVIQVLSGPESEVTVKVRRHTYAALRKAVEHHSFETHDERYHDLHGILFEGLRHPNRSVRLAAGYAFASTVRAHGEREANGGIQVQRLFTQMNELYEGARPSVKETLILATGRLEQSPNTLILRKMILFLVAQLTSDNPVLQGSALLKMTSAAKCHKKALYPFILPFMDEIAPFIVSRLISHPNLVHELCFATSIRSVDFVSVTLPHTLPHLFANCDQKVLDAVAVEMDTQPALLFMPHSHLVFAHLFLMESAEETQRGLQFVLKVFVDAAQTANLSIQSLVTSAVVPLLAELTIVMGDEDERMVELARQALRKVERSLVVSSHRGRVPPPPSLGSFLKSYMMGVIQNINDMLQDVHGKKSVETKLKILRSIGVLVQEIGPAICNVGPQIMATFQTMVSIPELSDVTLRSWHIFLSTLDPADIGAHIGLTSAAFVSSWATFTPKGQATAIGTLNYIVGDMGKSIGKSLDDMADLSAISQLSHIQSQVMALRRGWSLYDRLQRLLERTWSDNLTVAIQSLGELRSFMLTDQKKFIRDLASGDMFDPLVGQVVTALFFAACRDGEGTEDLRLLAFECIGILGAVDPDRCEFTYNETKFIVLRNFDDEGESVTFALHLIRDLLVGAFRSTSDIKYQTCLAFSIQELLKVCHFTPALIETGSTGSIALRVRNRWNSLPKHVLETISPLLTATFTSKPIALPQIESPIYPTQLTYREWIQLWTTSLILKAAGQKAKEIFGAFRSAVQAKDVVVSRHIFPHLILNILISGPDRDATAIRAEILAVLDDQVNPESTSSADKKLLSAQAVFMLLDHLNSWVRIIRQEINSKKADNKRARPNQTSGPVEDRLLRVDSVLSSIDQNLMARAALQCRAYARALMNFEQQILTLRSQSPTNKDLPDHYERLHEIYAHLDEPDGMEGVSTLILSPTLEHQIRQHESTGRWTSAQSCWEVRLQQSPDNVDFHLGLLRCLRNLGHYDTLRTHVRGVLTRYPEWESALAGFQVESAWMVGAWEDVQHLVDRTSAQTPAIIMARLLLAMRTGEVASVSTAISAARSMLGAPIIVAGPRSYRRSYDAVLNLHLMHELEMIHDTITAPTSRSQGGTQQKRRKVLNELSRALSARLDATLPTFRTREPVLSMRRTAFSLTSASRPASLEEIGKSWLASAKIARKAGQWQTAYSAMLQAQHNIPGSSFMESAKLIKATGEPLRALQELENSMQLMGIFGDRVLDLTEDDEQTKSVKAKAQVLRARWMNESGRYEVTSIYKIFSTATSLCPDWESCHYHTGQFHDECFKNLPVAEQVQRGMKMNLYTVRSFTKAILFGSKYVYQTVPRLLTIWLDVGEDPSCAGTDIFRKLNDHVAKAIRDAPAYKWFTAFPQIVSRVGHTNPEVYKHLSKLIVKVMEEYPKQALWLFSSVVKSTKSNREARGKQILDQLRNNPSTANTNVPRLINQCVSMTNELLGLCDHYIDDESKRTLSMKKDFPRLASLARSELIIPLQESLTASLPPTSSSGSTHQPFPPDAPTFQEFFDEIEIMRSLAKPRKISIRGSNGQVYTFLGKPKDDLRKDARLMDFNSIINKLLKSNSESRRRQLHIRTYGVVTLNEECGFIQWVPNTTPIRPILIKGYDGRRIRSWSTDMSDTFKHIKELPEREAGPLYVEKILPIFPPIFHEWFLETFPEPTAWLASRLAYGRTAAVMSMVGFILGLGDRHCENILLDTQTGDVVHVDFNCLFEKGKTLETPERVPFRLTQNVVDALGVTGVEGVFRMACEITLQLLRDNKDSLMSVLDAFIHDPLVEWEDEKRKLEREPSRRNHVKPSVDLRMLAKTALNPIEKKLKGIYSTSKERQEKEISTSNLVQMLIQEATDPGNLAKMYPGWASWH